MGRMLLLGGLAALALAQSPPGDLSFEVASMKSVSGYGPDAPLPGPPFRGGPGTGDPEHLVIQVRLPGLVAHAYGVQVFRVFGPDWIQSAMYAINAKVSPGATKEQVNVMLQNLLIDRLGLRVHHESRVLPTYRLTVDAKGPKLKASEEGSTVNLAAPGARAVPDSQGFVPVPRGQNIVAIVRDGHLRITTNRATVDQLIAFLQDSLDHPVIDETGLIGAYDLRLDFASIHADANADPAPTLVAALKDQLGLDLRLVKAPMDVIVIDAASREPKPN